MKGKYRTLLLALGLGLLLVGATAAYQALSPSLQEGSLPGAGQSNSSSASSGSSSQQPTPAPSFQMESPDGDTLEFSDFLGEKPVVLNFWASTCPPCKAEMPDLQAAWDSYGEEIHFVLVNVGAAMDDTREKAETYLSEEGYELPVYYDIEFNAISTYGVNSFPLTFFIDADGNLQAYWMGQMSQEILQTGMNLIAPDVVEAP